MPPHPLLVAPTATPTVVCRVAGTDTVALLPLLPPPLLTPHLPALLPLLNRALLLQVNLQNIIIIIY